MILVRVKDNEYYMRNPEKVPWAEPGLLIMAYDNTTSKLPHFRVYPENGDGSGWVLWPHEAEVAET